MSDHLLYVVNTLRYMRCSLRNTKAEIVFMPITGLWLLYYNCMPMSPGFDDHLILMVGVFSNSISRIWKYRGQGGFALIHMLGVVT
jgi:hypothetical protein